MLAFEPIMGGVRHVIGSAHVFLGLIIANRKIRSNFLPDYSGIKDIVFL